MRLSYRLTPTNALAVERNNQRYYFIKGDDITVKVTADVNDAISGFKALSRELRETTKAVRELEQAYKDVEETVKNMPMQLDEKGKLSIIGAPDIGVMLDGKKIGETVSPKLSESDEYIELIAYDISEKLPIHYDDAVELLKNVTLGRTDLMLERWKDGNSGGSCEDEAIKCSKCGELCCAACGCDCV